MKPEQAFDEYHQAVYGFAYRFTRRADVAEDIVRIAGDGEGSLKARAAAVSPVVLEQPGSRELVEGLRRSRGTMRRTRLLRSADVGVGIFRFGRCGLRQEAFDPF
jgi:hypothetical protein